MTAPGGMIAAGPAAGRRSARSAGFRDAAAGSGGRGAPSGPRARLFRCGGRGAGAAGIRRPSSRPGGAAGGEYRGRSAADGPGAGAGRPALRARRPRRLWRPGRLRRPRRFAGSRALRESVLQRHGLCLSRGHERFQHARADHPQVMPHGQSCSRSRAPSWRRPTAFWLSRTSPIRR